MTGLTSGKSHKDPQPYMHRASGERAATHYNGWMEYAPRPRYDNHNPILTRFRTHRGETPIDLYLDYTDEKAERDPVLVEIVFSVKATPEQIRHAHRVLTKLANVYKEA